MPWWQEPGDFECLRVRGRRRQGKWQRVAGMGNPVRGTGVRPEPRGGLGFGAWNLEEKMLLSFVTENVGLMMHSEAGLEFLLRTRLIRYARCDHWNGLRRAHDGSLFGIHGAYGFLPRLGRGEDQGTSRKKNPHL